MIRTSTGVSRVSSAAFSRLAARAVIGKVAPASSEASGPRSSRSLAENAVRPDDPSSFTPNVASVPSVRHGAGPSVNDPSAFFFRSWFPISTSFEVDASSSTAGGSESDGRDAWPRIATVPDAAKIGRDSSGTSARSFCRSSAPVTATAPVAFSHDAGSIGGPPRLTSEALITTLPTAPSAASISPCKCVPCPSARRGRSRP